METSGVHTPVDIPIVTAPRLYFIIVNLRLEIA